MTSADAQWRLSQYFAEIAARFDAGYDPARGLPAGAELLNPPQGLYLAARLDGAPVGCVGLKLTSKGYAEIKRMWVSPQARGLGLGRRLLDEIEARARALSVTSLRLDTNSALIEARALYASCGHREAPDFNGEPYADHWFEKALNQNGSGRPDQAQVAIGFFHFSFEEWAVHDRTKRRGQIGLHVFTRVAFVVLVDQDMGGPQELGFRPLLVARQALGKIAGSGNKQRRPATPARAWTGEAIDCWRGREILVRAMHAKAMQTARQTTEDRFAHCMPLEFLCSLYVPDWYASQMFL